MTPKPNKEKLKELQRLEELIYNTIEEEEDDVIEIEEDSPDMHLIITEE